ncbi:root hair defective 3 GTP-binding protein-domain-containing protein [Circinella umbellata]|nr:root hair defective 3 GTP-binding protein-domain-containing protein [Circinella umbellata]
MPANNNIYSCHQIIDENQEFSDKLSAVIEQEWELSEAKLDYHVVSIFGSQSTGKSTLLNTLFGTSFDVMDASQGRSQTTRGIWMSRAKQLPILLMDIEGADGAERGEDQNFERKAALFALATSEVVIFNLCESQVNLYAGGNMSMLKMVIQVNLELFQNQKGARQEKTLILIVIRDYIGQTPIEKLKKNLQDNFDTIWNELNKTTTTTTTTIHDFFDFMFIGLPHKILSSDQFDKETDDLQLRFIDQTNSDYVFQPQYHKQIPIDGYHKYVSDIWTQIRMNKSLDLPTQQELLSQFRCNEISNDILAQLEEMANKLKTCALEEDGIIEELGKRMREYRDTAIKEYQTSASCYLPEFYEEKEKYLLSILNKRFHALYETQLKSLHIKAIEMFNYELRTTIFESQSSCGRVEGYAKEIIASSRETVEDYFENNAKELLLPGTDWSYTPEFDRLKITLETLSENARCYDPEKFNDDCKRNKEDLKEVCVFIFYFNYIKCFLLIYILYLINLYVAVLLRNDKGYLKLLVLLSLRLLILLYSNVIVCNNNNNNNNNNNKFLSVKCCFKKNGYYILTSKNTK